MTALVNALARLVTTQIAAVLSRTSSSASAAFDTGEYEGQFKVTLAAGAATAGSSPTLDVKVTECATSGGSFTDVASGAFTQVTDTAGVQTLVFDRNKVKRYIKADWTIGGTSSPAFPFGVIFEGIKKYV